MEEDWSSAHITSEIFQDKRKCSACDLKCRYCVVTLWGRCTQLTCLTWSSGMSHMLAHLHEGQKWVKDTCKEDTTFETEKTYVSMTFLLQSCILTLTLVCYLTYPSYLIFNWHPIKGRFPPESNRGPLAPDPLNTHAKPHLWRCPASVSVRI